MSIAALSLQKIKILFFGCLILFAHLSWAEIIGLPPYHTIDIPPTAYGDHFDMVKDNNNVLYISSIKGVKIYNGIKWQLVETTNSIRRLYYDNHSRVYVGGMGIIGYIEVDKFGQYQYTDITPVEHKNIFGTIWSITSCNGQIYFQDIYDIFRFDTETAEVENWHFHSKLGSTICINRQLILQDRDKGLLKLEQGQWLKHDIILKNNELIYKFAEIDKDAVFILSNNNDWRIIDKNNIITHLEFNKQLPSLDNYVSVESLNNGKFVLGSNNGLLTFIDSHNLNVESFKLTNNWINKIIYTDDGRLIVMTEFEIFFLEWPSPIRVLGKDSGISSNIFKMTTWDDKSYLASSAGVFVEDQEQLLHQHQLFKRLDWTNKEAWDLLPLNDNQIILAESYHLLLIEDGRKKPISEVIYPREIKRSQYNPDIIFVTTEHDVQILYHQNKSWQLNKVFNSRPISLVEQEAGTLLLSTETQGLLKVTFDPSNGKKISQVPMTEQLGLSKTTGDELNMFSADKGIIAFNQTGIYQLIDNQFVKKTLNNLDQVRNGEKLIQLKQMQDGKFYGSTAFKVLYQDYNNTWQSRDMSRYLRGIINDLKVVKNEIIILSNGVLVTYLPDIALKNKPSNFKLLLTEIHFTQKKEKQDLPIYSDQVFNYDQGEGNISFTFILNDIVNSDKAQYRYRLRGDNDEWSDYFHDNLIHFNNLPAGEYSFELQAKDITNQVYDSQVYKFVVNPSWYLTKIAKIIWLVLCISFIFLLLHLFVRWREKIHEAQKVELKKIINTKTAEIKQVNINLQKIARQDCLTGLSNRLYLDEFINNISVKKTKNITVMMLDMDYFKKYNDKNGHLAGDELLKRLARYLMEEINRSSDMVARYGGEEFVIILHNPEPGYAHKKAEKIRQLIEDIPNKTSISIGISESDHLLNPNTELGANELIDQADKALYQAKRAGRNCIKFFQQQ